MKKYYFFFTFFLLTFDFLLFAQAPQGIPYQAIARNASGVAIANTAVKVRFSIRDSIATGAIKYQETHNPTTSALGLFSVNVGMGSVVSGTFSGINWGKNAKFLQVELNTTGGTTYTDLGTTQMMAVPYALQANAIKMRTSASGDTLFTGGGNFIIVPGISASNPILNQPEAPVTDIDGNVYQTVRIGTQVWMRENLKVSLYRNGNPIITGLTNSAWAATTSGAYSIYNNDPSNNTIYGKLYNWYAVNDSRGLCPLGWHVPNDAEWKTLETLIGLPISELDNVGARGVGGGMLKSTSTLWALPNSNASNSTGFSALPSGDRTYTGFFENIGAISFWWTSSEVSPGGAMDRNLYANNAGIGRGNGLYKQMGMAVRCIKN